ncbi:hypothetical protein HRI_003964500 [Hibiscus trionum]|uniref:Uncharacterized protein n=1 Tax=Hibiscus trionum TaxID=183268 RepID=A0A9W7IY00_HIBTR|nr:hypothetical protein HRI_003964500 [Hibiscus trionum]
MVMVAATVSHLLPLHLLFLSAVSTTGYLYYHLHCRQPFFPHTSLPPSYLSPSSISSSPFLSPEPQPHQKQQLKFPFSTILPSTPQTPFFLSFPSPLSPSLSSTLLTFSANILSLLITLFLPPPTVITSSSSSSLFFSSPPPSFSVLPLSPSSSAIAATKTVPPTTKLHRELDSPNLNLLSPLLKVKTYQSGEQFIQLLSMGSCQTNVEVKKDELFSLRGTSHEKESPSYVRI